MQLSYSQTATLATLILCRKPEFYREVLSRVLGSYDPKQFVTSGMMVAVFQYIMNGTLENREICQETLCMMQKYPVMTVEYCDTLIERMIDMIPEYPLHAPAPESPSATKILPLLLLHLHHSNDLIRWDRVDAPIQEGLRLNTTSRDSWATMVLEGGDNASLAYIDNSFKHV